MEGRRGSSAQRWKRRLSENENESDGVDGEAGGEHGAGVDEAEQAVLDEVRRGRVTVAMRQTAR